MSAAVHHLSIDIETYSDVDLRKAGLYRYAQSPAFTLLLFAYSLDSGPVQVIDLASGGPGSCFPLWLHRALKDPSYIKHAYNAAFEWYCLCQFFRWNPAREGQAFLSQWRCTKLHGLYCGYPESLDGIGKALGLTAEQQKMSAGKALIRYFCTPCTPTKNNGQRTRNLPHHDPAKWELFKAYNAQDVATEMEVERRLSAFPVPDEVQAQWVTDQIINCRGVAVDMDLVRGALALDAAARNEYLQEAAALSGLENPNSVPQLIQWLQTELADENVPNLNKATVTELLGKELPNENARRMLELRQALSKTSNTKYAALEASVCADGRVRGLLQFYGAARTGRWAGRIVQPQNLPRTYIQSELLPLARELVEGRQMDALKLVFGSVSDTLSQLIRTALVAAPGCTLVDADFSSIEARVIAWLSGEAWALEVFRTHGKIYEATAAQLYDVPMERIVKGNPEYALRQYGKAATLALGYQGGAAALITAGHLDKDTPEEKLLDIRDRWRQKNPHIVKFWHEIEAAAKEAVQTGRCVELPDSHLAIAREYDPTYHMDFLVIRLPNGRKLYYAQPHMGKNRFGQPSLCYYGQNQASKWQVLETYGGKLAENITQAVARDCLAEAIDRVEAAGYRVVFHVHDELVVEAPNGSAADLERITTLMSQIPDWADGLPLNAEGWVNPFFKKE